MFFYNHLFYLAIYEKIRPATGFFREHGPLRRHSTFRLEPCKPWMTENCTYSLINKSFLSYKCTFLHRKFAFSIRYWVSNKSTQILLGHIVSLLLLAVYLGFIIIQIILVKKKIRTIVWIIQTYDVVLA